MSDMSLIIVNGLPGSGKSSLARELATELSLPLFSKDAIKETLADSLTSFRSKEETSSEWSPATIFKNEVHGPCSNHA